MESTGNFSSCSQFICHNFLFRALKFYGIEKAKIEDVKMKLEDIKPVKFGEPFTIRVHIDNSSHQNRTLTAMVRSSSVYNNGVPGMLIRKSSGEFSWRAGKRKK